MEAASGPHFPRIPLCVGSMFFRCRPLNPASSSAGFSFPSVLAALVGLVDFDRPRLASSARCMRLPTCWHLSSQSAKRSWNDHGHRAPARHVAVSCHRRCETLHTQNRKCVFPSTAFAVGGLRWSAIAQTPSCKRQSTERLPNGMLISAPLPTISEAHCGPSGTCLRHGHDPGWHGPFGGLAMASARRSNPEGDA
jgi:hypothetical protein